MTRDTSERREARYGAIGRGKVADREKAQCNPVRRSGVSARSPSPIRRDILHPARVGGELHRSSPTGSQREDVTDSRRVLVDRGPQLRPHPFKPFTPEPRPKHGKLPHGSRLLPRPQPPHGPQAYANPTLRPWAVRMLPTAVRHAPTIGPNPCYETHRAGYREVASKGEPTADTGRTDARTNREHQSPTAHPPTRL